MIEYSLIYSGRRTLSLSVRDGEVLVRAPKRTPRRIVDAFVEKHSEWVLRCLQKEKEKKELFDNLTDEKIRQLKSDAKRRLTELTERYSKIMEIKYGRVTVTSAKTRFGSCSSKGNISYSYRLMLYPEKAQEYVVVHELAHVLEMNHSKKFYQIIASVLPDYKERIRMLK